MWTKKLIDMLERGSRQHRKKLLNPKIEDTVLCNCRKNRICPMNGKCLVKNIVYRAEVITEKSTESYIGLTGTTFKERYRNHMSDIKKSESKPCQLVKYVKNLEEQKEKYNINWSVLTKATQFSPITNICNLCINEKYFILFKPELGTLNTRNEITANCRHKISKLLDKG